VSGTRRSPTSVRYRLAPAGAADESTPAERGGRGNCGATAPRKRPQRVARRSETAVAAAPALRLLVFLSSARWSCRLSRLRKKLSVQQSRLLQLGCPRFFTGLDHRQVRLEYVLLRDSGCDDERQVGEGICLSFRAQVLLREHRVRLEQVCLALSLESGL
jgi:hypothetical protein